jgi:hypothetical protein
MMVVKFVRMLLMIPVHCVEQGPQQESIANAQIPLVPFKTIA